MTRPGRLTPRLPLINRKALIHWNSNSRLPLPSDSNKFELYGHNLQELRALLPSGAGPSKADFINPVLRNGIEDINLINFAVHYLECLQKCDEEGENPWLLSLRDAARKRWQVQVSINAKLLRMYKEAPYKTIIHDCYGHCPAVVYQKDKHGQCRKPVPIDFCYKNEVGLYSRVLCLKEHVFGICLGSTSSTSSCFMIGTLTFGWRLMSVGVRRCGILIPTVRSFIARSAPSHFQLLHGSIRNNLLLLEQLAAASITRLLAT